ncbi:helix-turn-helix domain-containing protein [Streptomyces fuscigenes]|uniref:helix-turn-helix domain-containing protein n=1 Tax=Streptomyces fuscigenes TaxID=1528880 RepID=UPI001F3EAA02|nr:helix-turn-helix transcriptional regulator [Streptomyces fuscigenes]MCF3960341.1 helix-turn-helix domain-containing protein [Streptomyces fuscigenes]
MNDRTDRKRVRRPRGAPLDHAPEGVAYARDAAGLTKRSLAGALGISEQLMCDIEAGRRNAAPELLERMAARLDCPLVVLLAKGAQESAYAGQRPESGTALGP